MTNGEIIKLTADHVMNTYGRFPIAIVRGEGRRVWDANGRVYLDFTSGLAVCNLGHCHPKVVAAIRAQAGTLMHISNLYHIGPQAELAALLTKNSFADKVFFCNSGAEANEAAIKLARKYFSVKGSGRHQIITMEKSFHGRTLAALAATGQGKYQQGFEPLLEKFVYVPFNDAAAVRNAISSSTAAVMVEPIQGEGGVNVPSESYLKEIKAVCKEAGALLMYDEVQVGVGRTGRLFAYEHSGVAPDIMTLAKGLAGGAAIGAMCATDEVAQAFTPGTHASTFGGNPLATAAGIAAIKTIIEDCVLDNCVRMGEYLRAQLEGLKKDFPFVKEVRGKGLILAAELSGEIKGADIVRACLEAGLLINCIGDRTLRFIPALTVTSADVDEMMGTLKAVLKGM